tara:strand:+ start:11241 stop:11900 length:660 start_codon:yes stop_codon:yes gene_type:complete
MGLANETVTPGRSSLLDAVNVLLECIGEQPINTLDLTQIQDARIAERTLLEFHKEGQIKGWSWNTEHCYPFSKNDNGEIEIPTDIVEFALDPYLYANRYILRGQRIYDTTNRSYTMETTLTKIEADIIRTLSWSETPEAYNRWIIIRSARVFVARVLGDEAAYKFTAQDERDAQIVLERMEQRQEQPNLLTGGRDRLPFRTYEPASGLMTRRLSAGIRL